jgi:hypothetical protein
MPDTRVRCQDRLGASVIPSPFGRPSRKRDSTINSTDLITFRNSSGNFAIFAAIRRAHSLVLGECPTYPPSIESEQFYTDSE